MSYQVLARKYRPQLFKEVLGQEHITRTLQNAVDSKRLHHAYLFTGVRGVGKTTVARLLAKALNCEKGPTTEPCNDCKSCLEITRGSDLDVQEIDGASNTGVDDVREIREHIKYLPSGGRYKIYIIDEVHMLSTAAFNALLKTLEEPPSHVIFIFATTEVQKIPATILSRCQRYDFRRIAVPTIIEGLKQIVKNEGFKVDPEALYTIAIEADGSLRDAESLFDQALAFCGGVITYEGLKGLLGFMDRSEMRELLTAIAERQTRQALDVTERVFQQGGNLVRLAQELLTLLRSLLVFSATSSSEFLKDLLPEDRKLVEVLAPKNDVTTWEQMFKIAYRGVEEVGRSRTPKMVLEVLLIELAAARSARSIDSLMEKIDGALQKTEGERNIQNHLKTPLSPSHLPSPIKGEAASIPNPVAHKAIHEGEWRAFLNGLKNEKPQLYSILEHGLFLGSRDREIRLEYGSESVYGEMLADSHRKNQLESSLEKFFGTKYMVEVQFRNDGVLMAEKKNEREEKKERVRRLKEETLAHEIVKEATKILEADIKEIKIK